MPGAALHFVLATQALDAVRTARLTVPFDPHDARSGNAYYHGAMGPDAGHLPGGHRPFSELAHTVRTGRLVSELITSARTDVERAFAWGWLTHVFADRLVHPWIGRGVAALGTGASSGASPIGGPSSDRAASNRVPTSFVSGEHDPLGHLRVELGVDAWYAAHYPCATSVRLSPVFDERTVIFVENAFDRSYGPGTLPPGSALASHASGGRRVNQGLRLMRLLWALISDDTPSVALARIRWLLQTVYRAETLRGVTLAFLNPVPPARWMLRGVEEASDLFREMFVEAVGSGGADIGDFHLDTGEPLRHARWNAEAPT